MVDPIREQMDNIQRDASKVYRVDSPYKDFRAPQYPEAAPIPDDKQLSDLTPEQIKARFPQLYQKPETASAEPIPPAFAAMAQEETILGIPIGKRPSAGVTDMEPMLQFDLFGKAVKKENRVTLSLLGAGQVVDRTYTP